MGRGKRGAGWGHAFRGSTWGRAVLVETIVPTYANTRHGIFARHEILHSTESKHHLDMENLVPAPSGPPVKRAAAASEFGGAVP